MTRICLPATGRRQNALQTATKHAYADKHEEFSWDRELAKSNGVGKAQEKLFALPGFSI